MDSIQASEAGAIVSEGSERRDFMATAAKLASVLAILGLTGEASAADPKATRMLLEEAIRTGDAKGALSKHGKSAQLNDAQTKALQSLSAAELGQLKSLQQKLAPLHGAAAGDGNGFF